MTLVHWTKPTVPNASSFAEIDGAIMGYVSSTAFADDRWIAEVLPRGPGVPGMYCYAGNEARAKQFVERWLRHHAPDTRGWQKRKPMPHEGPVNSTP